MAFFEFPHTRTYDSDLAWLIKAYKILTGKVNNIEQTIEDTINEALQGDELKQLIAQLIAEVMPLNVKYPPAESGLNPATGDGETDDTAALQAMITYANANNMPMLFPAGVYRVTGLNVNADTVFQGFDATLMLAPISAAPLINLTADLASSGLTLNGNLGGQTTAQNVINIVNGSFAITNTTIMGGESCIEGTLVGDSIIGDSFLRNFQEYAIHAEGTGSFAASNVVVPSVASGGAMRFMRIDCNNCTVSNFTSQATVPIGFEITGDNNAISANIPNAETAVNDGGTGNTWTIIGKDEKLYFEGSASHDYQNFQENITGDYTQNVGDFEGTASGSYAFNSEDFVINSTNPLTYKVPQKLNNQFKFVPFKTPDGTQYNVLVEGELASGNVANVKDYGATGDGLTDDTNAFVDAINSELPVYVPSGDYVVTEISPFVIFGEGKLLGAELTFSNDFSYCAGLLFENTTGTAIKINAKNSIIERCIFNNNAHDIALDGIGNKILNCNISNFKDGININNSSNVDSGDNVISNCLMDAGGNEGSAGITLVSGGGLYITNTKILHCTYGIIESVQTPSTSILLVANTSIESASENAIALVGGENCFSRIVLSGLEIVGGGINASNVDEMSINNCILDTVGKNAITLTNCSNVVIEGNISKYNSAFVNQATVTENLILKNNNAVNNIKIHGSGNSFIEFVENVTTSSTGIIAAPDGNCILEVQGTNLYCLASFPSLVSVKSETITVNSNGISGPAGTYSVKYTAYS